MVEQTKSFPTGGDCSSLGKGRTWADAFGDYLQVSLPGCIDFGTANTILAPQEVLHEDNTESGRTSFLSHFKICTFSDESSRHDVTFYLYQNLRPIALVGTDPTKFWILN